MTKDSEEATISNQSNKNRLGIPSAGTQRNMSSSSKIRHEYYVKKRRRIYSTNYWIKCVYQGPAVHTDALINLEDEQSMKAAYKWIAREVQALLGSKRTNIEMAYILDRIIYLLKQDFHVLTIEFWRCIYHYFEKFSSHFQHELYHFLRSGLTIKIYDQEMEVYAEPHLCSCRCWPCMILDPIKSYFLHQHPGNDPKYYHDFLPMFDIALNELAGIMNRGHSSHDPRCDTVEEDDEDDDRPHPALELVCQIYGIKPKEIEIFREWKQAVLRKPFHYPMPTPKNMDLQKLLLNPTRRLSKFYDESYFAPNTLTHAAPSSSCPSAIEDLIQKLSAEATKVCIRGYSGYHLYPKVLNSDIITNERSTAHGVFLFYMEFFRSQINDLMPGADEDDILNTFESIQNEPDPPIQPSDSATTDSDDDVMDAEDIEVFDITRNAAADTSIKDYESPLPKLKHTCCLTEVESDSESTTEFSSHTCELSDPDDESEPPELDLIDDDPYTQHAKFFKTISASSSTENSQTSQETVRVPINAGVVAPTHLAKPKPSFNQLKSQTTEKMHVHGKFTKLKRKSMVKQASTSSEDDQSELQRSSQSSQSLSGDDTISISKSSDDNVSADNIFNVTEDSDKTSHPKTDDEEDFSIPEDTSNSHVFNTMLIQGILGKTQTSIESQKEKFYQCIYPSHYLSERKESSELEASEYSDSDPEVWLNRFYNTNISKPKTTVPTKRNSPIPSTSRQIAFVTYVHTAGLASPHDLLNDAVDGDLTIMSKSVTDDLMPNSPGTFTIENIQYHKDDYNIGSDITSKNCDNLLDKPFNCDPAEIPLNPENVPPDLQSTMGRHKESMYDDDDDDEYKFMPVLSPAYLLSPPTPPSLPLSPPTPPMEQLEQMTIVVEKTSYLREVTPEKGTVQSKAFEKEVGSTDSLRKEDTDEASIPKLQQKVVRHKALTPSPDIVQMKGRIKDLHRKRPHSESSSDSSFDTEIEDEVNSQQSRKPVVEPQPTGSVGSSTAEDVITLSTGKQKSSDRKMKDRHRNRLHSESSSGGSFDTENEHEVNSQKSKKPVIESQRRGSVGPSTQEAITLSTGKQKSSDLKMKDRHRKRLHSESSSGGSFDTENEHEVNSQKSKKPVIESQRRGSVGPSTQEAFTLSTGKQKSSDLKMKDRHRKRLHSESSSGSSFDTENEHEVNSHTSKKPAIESQSRGSVGTSAQEAITLSTGKQKSGDLKMKDRHRKGLHSESSSGSSFDTENEHEVNLHPSKKPVIESQRLGSVGTSTVREAGQQKTSVLKMKDGSLKRPHSASKIIMDNSVDKDDDRVNSQKLKKNMTESSKAQTFNTFSTEPAKPQKKKNDIILFDFTQFESSDCVPPPEILVQMTEGKISPEITMFCSRMRSLHTNRPEIESRKKVRPKKSTPLKDSFDSKKSSVIPKSVQEPLTSQQTRTEDATVSDELDTKQNSEKLLKFSDASLNNAPVKHLQSTKGNKELEILMGSRINDKDFGAEKHSKSNETSADSSNSKKASNSSKKETEKARLKHSKISNKDPSKTSGSKKHSKSLSHNVQSQSTSSEKQLKASQKVLKKKGIVKFSKSSTKDKNKKYGSDKHKDLKQSSSAKDPKHRTKDIKKTSLERAISLNKARIEKIAELNKGKQSVSTLLKTQDFIGNTKSNDRVVVKSNTPPIKLPETANIENRQIDDKSLNMTAETSSANLDLTFNSKSQNKDGEIPSTHKQLKLSNTKESQKIKERIIKSEGPYSRKDEKRITETETESDDGEDFGPPPLLLPVSPDPMIWESNETDSTAQHQLVEVTTQKKVQQPTPSARKSASASKDLVKHVNIAPLVRSTSPAMKQLLDDEDSSDALSDDEDLLSLNSYPGQFLLPPKTQNRPPVNQPASKDKSKLNYVMKAFLTEESTEHVENPKTGSWKDIQESGNLSDSNSELLENQIASLEMERDKALGSDDVASDSDGWLLKSDTEESDSGEQPAALTKPQKAKDSKQIKGFPKKGKITTTKTGKEKSPKKRL